MPTDNAGESATRPDSPVETVAVGLLGSDPQVVQTLATTLVTDGDGGMHVRTTLSVPGTVRYTFDAPADSVLDEAYDRTVAVVDADRELVGGLAAPVGTGADGAGLRLGWSEVDEPGTALALDLVVDGGEQPEGGETSEDDAVAYPVTIDVHLGRDIVSGVEWGDREGGRSLAVTPTSWGRDAGATSRTYGWADVVRLEPSADTTVMRNQFLCHVDGARQKDTWNLEPWRPEISFVGYLLARCNPT